jgi:transposase
VYQLHRRLCTDGTVGSSDGVFSFLFFSLLDFDPRKIDYLLNLACGILASLGHRIVYKDMLDNMVSPMDHVVMNHQNHTRTNGI